MKMKLWNARRPLGPSRRDTEGHVTVWSTDSVENTEQIVWAYDRDTAKAVASEHWSCDSEAVVVRRTRLAWNEDLLTPPDKPGILKVKGRQP